MTYTIYRIYYKSPRGNDNLVYVGRTKQPLKNRLRGHLRSGSGNAMTKRLDIGKVSRITYATVPTNADMIVYEVYYIVRDHPLLNRDDRAEDDPTITLPELDFSVWDSPLFEKWRKE